MNYETLLTAIENGILTITINRPKQLNALNRAVFSELEQVMQNALADAEIKGIIITGSGEKAFVAGADIKEFAEFSAAEGRQLAKNGHRIFRIVENSPKPVIAAINGFALGGGCELAMACHLRLASEKARFGQPEVNLGLTPGYGGTQRLVQLVGKGKAMEWLISGEMLRASEALQYGLINYMTKPDELMEKTLELMRKITAKSPMAIKGVINAVNAYFTEGEDGFGREVEEFGKCFDTEDFKEGTTAFLEKRKPDFPGK